MFPKNNTTETQLFFATRLPGYGTPFTLLARPLLILLLILQFDDMARQTQKRHEELKGIKGQIAELTRYAQRVNGEIEALKNQVSYLPPYRKPSRT